MRLSKVLIAGVSGQDGYFLSEMLRRRGIDVLGFSRFYGDVIGDVVDFDFVESVIKQYQPDYIFNFAANSTTQHDALFDNHLTISTGSLNILECVRLHCPAAKVFLSGSAMQFKNEGTPIDESSTFEASSPYAVARIQSVYAARYYRLKFGMAVYVGYFFNHDSPRRSEIHVNQKIVSFIKRISEGSQEKLELGNVDVRKEFSYAGDIVEAVWMLVNQSEIYEAIIGSGKAYSIREWAEYCFKKINMNLNDFLVIKQNYVPEYKNLVSNPLLIRKIGWEPKVDFYQLADMMME